MYSEVVEALEKAFDVMPEGVDLSKGGLGEIALAHELGHTLVAGDKELMLRTKKATCMNIRSLLQINLTLTTGQDDPTG